MSIETRGRRHVPSVVVLDGFRRRGRSEDGPQVRGQCPEPPEWLGDYGKQEWARVAPDLHRMGVLESIDVAGLAAYCDAYHVWRAAREEMLELEKTRRVQAYLTTTASKNVIQSPLLGVMNRARRDMIRYAAEYGMTPSGRTGLAGAPRVPS